jgi:hypothetical protein
MERIKKALEKARVDAKHSGTTLAPKTIVPTPKKIGKSKKDYQINPIDPVSLERNRIIAGNKEDPRTAAFDLLRTQVVLELLEKGFRTLAVTSPTADCGKTTVAINLALSAAQRSELMIVLCDLDLRRPRIDKYLGLHPDRALSDYLEGRASTEDVLVDPGISNLLILPNNKVYNNAAEMLSTPEMRSLIKDLQFDENNRVIIFDLPPILSTDDTIAFLPQVDCVLLVVADGLTKKPELRESLRLLEGSTLLGVVLNKSDVDHRPYY